jgi:hypothetical protein
LPSNSFTLERRAAEIAARLAAGASRPPPEALRNSGERRTPEKRALLARITRKDPSARDGG